MMSKKYDYEKAIKLIKETPGVVEASLGMHEDWFWTADVVFTSGEFVKDLTNKDLSIAGIQGSSWATPTLQLITESGERMIPCYTGESDKSPGINPFELGVLSGPIQDDITPLESE